MNYPSTLSFKVAAKTNGRCFYCNKPADEIDHFISRYWWEKWGLSSEPANYGSPNKIENLFPVCWTCNRKKSNKYPEDFVGNYFKAWNRYYRANQRVGLCLDVNPVLDAY